MRYVISIDLNDTVTLKNKFDHKKTIDIAINQIIAQNVFTNSVDLESSIKSSINRRFSRNFKKLRLEAYKNLDNYAEKKQIPIQLIWNLRERYLEELSNCSEGFFKSFINFLKFIEINFPTSTIIIQSFGLELPEAIEYLQNRDLNFNIVPTIVDFNSLDLNDFQTLQNLYESLEMGSILFWQNSYENWKRTKYKIGKLQFFSEEVQYVFFDDNADICSTIIDVDNNFKVCKRESIDKFIFKVNTGQALINENYFIESFRTLI